MNIINKIVECFVEKSENTETIKIKSKEELIDFYRNKAKKNSGKGMYRVDYLAYAFLRNKPYVLLERKINEDKFPIIGRNAFLNHQAGEIALKIASNAIGKNHYEAGKQGYDLYNLYKKEVHEWLMEKYKSSNPLNKEAA